MNFRTFIALFALLATASAVPSKYADSLQKNLKCSSSENLHNEKGTTYVYKYSNMHELNAATGEKSPFNLNADIEVTSLGGCEYIMRMRKVQLENASEEQKQHLDLEQYPIVFYQQSGHIRRISFSPNEDKFSVNVKRAILSVLQVSSFETAKVHEQDVFGRSETHYEMINKEREIVSMHKHKRIYPQHPLSALLWRKNDLTTLDCKLELNTEKHIIQKLKCKQSTEVAYLANSELATKAETSVELKFSHIKKEAIEAIDERKYIQGDLKYEQVSKRTLSQHSEKNKREAIALLDNIYKMPNHDESLEYVDRLAKLITELDAETLAVLDKKAAQWATESEEGQRVHLLLQDLIVQSGNSDALFLMLKKSLESQWSLRRDYWLMQLSNVRLEDNLSVEQLHILLKEHQRTMPRQVLLTIAKVMAQSVNHEASPELYEKSVDAITQYVSTENTPEMRLTAVLALKAFHLTKQAEDLVAKIAVDTKNVHELRVAALRTLAEQSKLIETTTEQVWRVFSQESETVELRIHAFRALIADEKYVQKTLDALKNVKNEQVTYYAGSYITSMKRDIATLPSEIVKTAIGTYEIPPAFISKGEQKTARHFHIRQPIDMLDTELHLDADMIFEQEQRLAAMRVHVQANKHYKRDAEHFEFYVRQRGLDRVTEKLQQFLQSTSFNRMIKQIYETISDPKVAQEYLNRMLRELSMEKDAYVSIDFAMHGSTVFSVSTEDLKQVPREEIAKYFTASTPFRWFTWRREQQTPTIGGFALYTHQHARFHASALFEGTQIRPSFMWNMELGSGFYMPHHSSRMVYSLKMHSKPHFNVKSERDAQGVPTKLTVEMLERQTTLLHIQTKAIFVNAQGTHKQIQLPSYTRKYEFNSLREIAGVQLNAHFETSRAESFVGQSLINMHLFLEKEDEAMRGWEFELRFPHAWTQIMSGKAYDWTKPFELVAAFRTPGSRITRDHKIEIRAQHDQRKSEVKLQLTAQKRSFVIQAALETSENAYSVQTQFTWNDYNTLLRAKLTRQEDGAYVPTLELQLPSWPKLSYTGITSFKYSSKKVLLLLKLNDEVTKETLFDFHLARSGSLMMGRDDFKISFGSLFTVPRSGGRKHHYTSHMKVTTDAVEYEQQYIYHASSQHVPALYRMSGKVKQSGAWRSFDKSQKSIVKYAAHFEFTYPSASGELLWNMNAQLRDTTKPHLESEFSVIMVDGKKKYRAVYVKQAWNSNFENGENTLSVVTQVPAMDLDQEMHIQVNTEKPQWPKYAKGSAMMTISQRDNTPMMKAHASFELNLSASRMFTTQAKLNYREHVLALTHEVERMGTKYQAKTSCTWAKDRKVEFTHTLLAERINNQLRHYEVEGQMRIPHLNLGYEFNHVLRLSSAFELKSMVKNDKQVVSEVRVFLSRDQPSSLYVDNRYLNLKADASITDKKERHVQLHINGKMWNLLHTSRLEHTPQGLEIYSKTTSDQQMLAEMRLKHNLIATAFVIDLSKKKMSVHYDRAAYKLSIMLKDDSPTSSLHHQAKFAFTLNSQAEIKVDFDGVNWMKLRALNEKEMLINVVLGNFHTQIESVENKSKWTWVTENKPRNIKYVVNWQVTEQGIRGDALANHDQQKSMEARFWATWEKESFLEIKHKKMNIKVTGNYNQKTMEIRAETPEMTHWISFARDGNTLKSKCEHVYQSKKMYWHEATLGKTSQVKMHFGDFDVQVNGQLPGHGEFKINSQKYEIKHVSEWDVSKWLSVDVKSQTQFKSHEYKHWLHFDLKEAHFEWTGETFKVVADAKYSNDLSFDFVQNYKNGYQYQEKFFYANNKFHFQAYKQYKNSEVGTFMIEGDFNEYTFSASSKWETVKFYFNSKFSQAQKNFEFVWNWGYVNNVYENEVRFNTAMEVTNGHYSGITMQMHGKQQSQDKIRFNMELLSSKPYSLKVWYLNNEMQAIVQSDLFKLDANMPKYDWRMNLRKSVKEFETKMWIRDSPYASIFWSPEHAYFSFMENNSRSDRRSFRVEYDGKHEKENFESTIRMIFNNEKSAEISTHWYKPSYVADGIWNVMLKRCRVQWNGQKLDLDRHASLYLMPSKTELTFDWEKRQAKMEISNKKYTLNSAFNAKENEMTIKYENDNDVWQIENKQKTITWRVMDKSTKQEKFNVWIKCEHQKYEMNAKFWGADFNLNGSFYNWYDNKMTWSVTSEPFLSKITLESTKEYFFFTSEIRSQRWAFDHKTNMKLDHQTAKFYTKTVSRDFNLMIDYNGQKETTTWEANYNIYSYKGFSKADWKYNGQIYVVHFKGEHQNSKFDGEFTFDHQHLKGEMQYQIAQFLYKYTFLVQPKDQGYEVQVHLEDEKQRPLFKWVAFFTGYSERTRSNLNYSSKLIVQDKTYSFNYVWHYLPQEAQQSLTVELNKQKYAYEVKMTSSAWDVNVWLPHEHQIYFRLWQHVKNSASVYEVQFYPNKSLDSRNYYSASVQYTAEYSENWQGHYKFNFGHSSIKKPFTGEFKFVWTPKREQVFNFDAKFDSYYNKEPVTFTFYVNNGHFEKQFSFRLHQTETSYIHVNGLWALNFPYHKQAFYWDVNGQFDKAVQGGYIWEADFAKHYYTFDVKNVNVFTAKWQVASKDEYSVVFGFEHGNVKTISVFFKPTSQTSRIVFTSRSGRTHEYKGTFSFTPKTGLHLNVFNEQASLAEFNLQRDHYSFVTIKANMKPQFAEIVKPQTDIMQVFSQYAHTQQHFTKAFNHIWKNAFEEHFNLIIFQGAKDTYNVIVSLLPIDVIKQVVGFVPTTGEQYVQAVSRLFSYFYHLFGRFTWELIPMSFEGIMQYTRSYFTLWYSFFYNVVAFFTEAFSYLHVTFHVFINEFHHLWEMVYKHIQNGEWWAIIGVWQNQFDIVLTYFQVFFDRFVQNPLNMWLEFADKNSQWYYVWSHVYYAIGDFSRYVRSFNLFGVFWNALELFFRPSSPIFQSSFEWQPQNGYFYTRFFFPSGLSQYI